MSIAAQDDRMHRTKCLVLGILLSVAGVAGCSSDDSIAGADGGSPVPFDAGLLHPDASMSGADASPGADSGDAYDAAQPQEASMQPDASTDSWIAPSDSSVAPDAFGTPDAPDAQDAQDASDAAAVVDASLLLFASACTQNAQCQSNLCFNFPGKGKYCTLPCQSANDCPGGAGGLGCSNGMNVCRVP
jgi:hypothetical protein